MNIISIDPSLISTALVVNGKIYNYCRESKVNLKKGMSKWYKSAEQYSKYRFIEFTKFSNYSEGEISKIRPIRLGIPLKYQMCETGAARSI